MPMRIKYAFWYYNNSECYLQYYMKKFGRIHNYKNRWLCSMPYPRCYLLARSLAAQCKTRVWTVTINSLTCSTEKRYLKKQVPLCIIYLGSESETKSDLHSVKLFIRNSIHFGVGDAISFCLYDCLCKTELKKQVAVKLILPLYSQASPSFVN